MNKTPRIAVIGGGWAGLAAAVSLARSKAQLCVYESSRSWGGRARHVEIEGCALDNGQHILVGAYSETLRLMHEVGVDTDALLLHMPLRLQMNNNLRIEAPDWPAPWGLAYGLISAHGLSLGEKLSAIAFMRRQRKAGFKLAHDETVDAFLARERQTDALRDSLWRPLCVAALNTPTKRASAQVFLNVLRDTLDGGRGASDLLLARGNLGLLFPDPATRYLADYGATLRSGTQIRQLKLATDGIMVDDEFFDAVILAVGPQHAAALLPAEAAFDGLRAQLAAFEYEPIYTCYLQYETSATLCAPMLGFSSSTLQWAFDRGALDAQHGLIAAVISGRGSHEALSRDALIETAQRELAPQLRNAGALRWARVIAEKRATFSCTPGLKRPDNQTPSKALFIAGDYTASDYPATLEAAVRSGLRAAASLQQRN